MDEKTNEFDEKARTWDDIPDRVHLANAVAEAINHGIPFDRSFTAMEYGCGTGLLSFPLKDRFSRITLVDNSPGMLDVVREKIKRNSIMNMVAVNIDLLEPTATISTTFSVIYCSMVLHHIGNVRKILTIWHSLLNRPGYLCVADLDSDNGLFHGKDFKGHNGFGRSDLKKSAIEAGFANVKFETVYKIQKIDRNGIDRSFPFFLMVAERPESI